jgi:AcrR family transcriptional regulator
MARPKEFDRETALDAAIGVFREHGFEGTSADMLTKAMKIGRQSLYDTFGDKWQLYCASLERYCAQETSEHVAALKEGKSALDGLKALLKRVATEARSPCLGLGSICEFGTSKADVMDIHTAPGLTLRNALRRRLKAAQIEGDASLEVNVDDAADFLAASISSIRIAARSGASDARLHALAKLALRSLQ